MKINCSHKTANQITFSLIEDHVIYFPFGDAFTCIQLYKRNVQELKLVYRGEMQVLKKYYFGRLNVLPSICLQSGIFPCLCH